MKKQDDQIQIVNRVTGEVAAPTKRMSPREVNDLFEVLTELLSSKVYEDVREHTLIQNFTKDQLELLQAVVEERIENNQMVINDEKDAETVKAFQKEQDHLEKLLPKFDVFTADHSDKHVRTVYRKLSEIMTELHSVWEMYNNKIYLYDNEGEVQHYVLGMLRICLWALRQI